MKTRAIVSSVALFLFAVVGVVIAEEAVKLDGVKCPISGEAVKADKFVEFGGGKVYFCCENCPKKFEADKTKYTAKANHQLAQTGQIVEVACPLTGKKLNAETAIDIAGVKVAFCCPNCKAAVEKMDDDAKIAKVFTDVSKSYKPASEAASK